jgi:ABC-type multidrug transport system ATPase subunit
MRIQKITVDNFKSLVGFDLALAKCTCLVGLNGTGKSTVLQFIDFLSQQVRGDIKGWLSERGWQARDLKSRLIAKANIDFAVLLADDTGETVGRWQATFNPTQLRCTSERINLAGVELEVSGGGYSITDTAHSAGARKPPRTSIAFSYEGSILSQLREEVLPNPLVEFKRFVGNIQSHDPLSPLLLRQRTRESAGSIGHGGERLAAFLHERGTGTRHELAAMLKEAYRQLHSLDTKSLRSGWKQLEIQEDFDDRKMVTEARHINDGMLRLIAILTELTTEHGFLLFDEIENGVNPELVEFVIDLLVSTPKQVMVTTHSPLILNYLEDEVARNGVMYLYKTPQGFTRGIRFFSIPSLAEKLSVMGPGEVFVDTNLPALAEGIAGVAGAQ